MLTINQLFHASCCMLYVFALYCTNEVTYFRQTFHSSVNGILKYFTIWNLILQVVYYFICLMNDLFGTNAVSPKKVPFLRKLKDYMHAALAFPISLFVGAMFWGLYFVDRELVYPRFLDDIIPTWLNHIMHTLIIVTGVVETIVSPRNYPGRTKALIGHYSFMLAYLIWMIMIYHISGTWPYPVMAVLSLPLRVVFILGMLFLTGFFYLICEKLDSLVWGNTYAKHQKLHTKSK